MSRVEGIRLTSKGRAVVEAMRREGTAELIAVADEMAATVRFLLEVRLLEDETSERLWVRLRHLTRVYEDRRTLI